MVEHGLPQYECFKIVGALKIARIDPAEDGTAWLTPEDSGYTPFMVPAAYVTKHAPQAGGYFVRYSDGYMSWSPADAFESGYRRLPSDASHVRMTGPAREA